MPQVQIPVHGSTGTPVARCEERIGSRTTMPMSERRPSTMNSFSPAEIPQTSMALQRRLQISELRFQLILHSIYHLCIGREVSKTQESSCFDFTRMLCYGSKKWRWSIWWIILNPRGQ